MKVFCLEMRDKENVQSINGYESLGIYSSREKALEALSHYSKEYSYHWIGVVWEEEVDSPTKVTNCIFYDLNGNPEE